MLNPKLGIINPGLPYTAFPAACPEAQAHWKL